MEKIIKNFLGLEAAFIYENGLLEAVEVINQFGRTVTFSPAEIEESAGTYLIHDGLSIGLRAEGSPDPGKTGRTNKPTVMFWVSHRWCKVKGKKVLKKAYCYSHVLVAALGEDGQQFLAEWRADPEAYMASHPELCKNKKKK